jgi:large subunit ribosomal protein L21
LTRKPVCTITRQSARKASPTARFALPEATQLRLRKQALKVRWFASFQRRHRARENKDEREMHAVIKTGGKQYRVAADQKIQIEKLVGKPGDQVEFTSVLMVTNGGSVDVGAPFVAGATVVGEIASQDRGPHLTIFKKRRRKHYRRKNGHRQDLTSVTIREILVGGAKPAKKAEAAPAAKADGEAAPAKKPRAKAKKAEAAVQE